MISSLDIFLWNRKVGTLFTDKKGYQQQTCFYFDSEFVKNGYDIAPLRASIRGAVAQNQLPIYPDKDKIFGGLPSFIADSLPDYWGSLLFNEWAKLKHIKAKSISALDRLAYIGRRGMGALEFQPSLSEDLEKPFKVEIEELSELAQKALEQAKSFHTMMSPDFVVESLFKVGTSAGGRRPKAVINVNPNLGDCYSGQVDTPLPGYVPMIIKFDEHLEIPTTRIEYSYYLMAIDAGMKMMPSQLVEGEKETHFITERFDRRCGEKIHVQTLAALDPLSASYEDLFKVALAIGVTPNEIEQLFVRMTMNVLCGNIDDHNKNFSFLMGKDGVWHIAPAYDFTFAIDVDAPAYMNTHCMTINGKNRDISADDLLAIAERFTVKGAESIISRLKEVVKNYPSYASQAGVPDSYITAILSAI
jgi:serine/threonine-protein kinase HipA